MRALWGCGFYPLQHRDSDDVRKKVRKSVGDTWETCYKKAEVLMRIVPRPGPRSWRTEVYFWPWESRVGFRSFHSGPLDRTLSLAENMTDNSLPGPKKNTTEDACEVSLISKGKEEKRQEKRGKVRRTELEREKKTT